MQYGQCSCVCSGISAVRQEENQGKICQESKGEHMRYRKKPVVIEAIQWTGENQREMFDFLTNGEKKDEYMEAFGEHFRIDHAAVKGGLVIKTLEGNHLANIGDYIIKGVAGEFYPCKPDIFEKTYEVAE
nr:MAG TPA: PGDYG protein [Bacteriophage sp.]